MRKQDKQLIKICYMKNMRRTFTCYGFNSERTFTKVCIYQINVRICNNVQTQHIMVRGNSTESAEKGEIVYKTLGIIYMFVVYRFIYICS